MCVCVRVCVCRIHMPSLARGEEMARRTPTSAALTPHITPAKGDTVRAKSRSLETRLLSFRFRWSGFR